MTPKDFNNLLQDTIMTIEKMLDYKAEHYAPGVERFHNFLMAGRIKDEAPEKACYGMWIKQHVALVDMIDQTNKEKPFKHGYIKSPPPTQERIDEVLHDLINYHILLKGMLYERYGYQPQSKRIEE